MLVRPFVAADISQRDAWLAARGLIRPMSRVPAVALIVDGVACGFLVQTDHDHALIDDVVTNPTAPSADRHAAIDSILNALEQAARDRGIPNFIINASDPSIVARCLSRGMTEHAGIRHFVRKV